MALWGKADAVYATGTVTVDLSNKTITGSGTTFTNASVGDVISIGVGNTFGQAVISGITSNTIVSIASTQFITGIGTVGFGRLVGVAYTISQKPKYTLEDGQYFAPDVKSNRYSAVFGVDTYEAAAASAATVGGKAGAYGVAHAGWVGVTTYVDAQGNFRVKSEVLVAMSGISSGTPAVGTYGDAGDDARMPDS
jgi:hypothetical protein